MFDEDGRCNSLSLPFPSAFARDQRAEAYYQRGEYVKAAQDLEYVVGCLPQWKGALMLKYTIGLFYGCGQQFEEAVPFLEEVYSSIAAYCNWKTNPGYPAIDHFLQDVRFSYFDEELLALNHPMASDTSPCYDGFYYTLGRGLYEAGRMEESLYCFRWSTGYSTGWRNDAWTNSPPLEIDADLWHGHVLRRCGRFDEAAGFLAECCGSWPLLTDELLAESALLVSTAPDVHRLFCTGGSYSGVRSCRTWSQSFRNPSPGIGIGSPEDFVRRWFRTRTCVSPNPARMPPRL